MAVTSGFFNSLNGDRRYNAEQMSEIFNGIINDGVFSSVGTAFAVTASEGNTVTIGIGRGWFNSAWIYNDAILPMTLSNSETLLNRIDAVVIEINHSIGVRSGSIKVVNGTPATTPENPTLANIDDVHQYPLAYIYRAAGSTSIVQANITNKVGTSDCPYVTGILEVQNIDNIVAQWQSEFDIWFANLEDSLSGDVAVNLANDILALQSQFEDLALYKTVYVELEDSQDNTIQDSNGNPIQGATVFSDSNAESGGSSGQPVVVSESPYKPGDTLTTARNDLDESWLLCNGAELTRTDYPQLAAQFPVMPTDLYNLTAFDELPEGGFPMGQIQSQILSIQFINNQYVMLCINNPSYGTPAVYVRYSDNVDGPWSQVDITAQITRPKRLRYVNGYYIVTGGNGSSGSNLTGVLAYATNIAGPWSSATVWQAISDETGQSECAVYDITYGNGYYVVAGGYNATYNNRIGYCTTLNGTWTQDYLERETYGSPMRFARYINGTFFIGRLGLEHYCAGTDMPLNPQAWPSLSISYNGYIEDFGMIDLNITNGIAIMTYGATYDLAGYREGHSRHSQTISWKPVDQLLEDTAWNTAHLPITCACVLYNPGTQLYVAFGSEIDSSGSSAVAYATDLSGPWVSGTVEKNSASGVDSPNENGRLFSAVIAGDKYAAVGYVQTAEHNGGALYVSNSDTFTLPSISLSDKTYTYIKAKED